MIPMHRLARTASLAGFALALLAGGPARAQVVAGWDFSQYFVDGALSLDGETLVATLPANYSDFDPSYGAGPESAAFGTMYLDGTYGSTATPLDIDNDPIVPSAAANGSLLSNLGAPENGEPSPDVAFDACTVLATQGQAFCNLLVLTALAPGSVVFEADLGPAGETADGWTVTFAGKTSAGTSTLSVDVGTDGGFSASRSVELTTTDALYTVGIEGAASQKALVRFGFDPMGTDQPFLDNVAISVPEAGSLAQALVAAAALAAVAHRRA
ncbi:MAG: hypothetical protein DCC71_18035 [Proteobacteria bacterium]|nr:MAG: hypothetical protein DCC71_18035 [Pseudomonadota bacterium]